MLLVVKQKQVRIVKLAATKTFKIKLDNASCMCLHVKKQYFSLSKEFEVNSGLSSILNLSFQISVTSNFCDILG